MNPFLLICMVGLPRSGKSTWARKQGFPIVNPDAIRLSLHGQRYSAKAEPWVWMIAHLMVESLFAAGHDTVILDSTCTTNERRNEWLSPQWSTQFKVIDTPKSECIARAKLQRDHDIIDIIEKMYPIEQLDPINNVEYDESPPDPEFVVKETMGEAVANLRDLERVDIPEDVKKDFILNGPRNLRDLEPNNGQSSAS